MSERVVINIADVQLVIKSDESAEFVNEIAESLDERIREIIGKSQKYSKFDAAVLCAIDFSAEKYHAERKIKSLEHQISLYEANDARFREEINELQKKYEVLLNEMKNSKMSVSSDDDENTASDTEIYNSIFNGEAEEKTSASDDEDVDIDSVNKQKLAEIERLLRNNS